jgi:RNA-directed DNA polymerase
LERSASDLVKVLAVFSRPNRLLLRVLATSVLAGEPTVEGVTERVAKTGSNWKWIRPLARRYVKAHAGQIRPRHRAVVRFLAQDKGFARAWTKHFDKIGVRNWLTEPQRMQPVAAAAAWETPAIESVGALAAWLRLDPSELNWFADLRNFARGTAPSSKLCHYDYRVLAKRSGGLRLIESPKPMLKQIQRKILSSIIDRVPIHPAVHGFCHGRSIKTFAQPHAGQRVVLRMDIQDFFPSISGARVQTLFRTMGYPESVADRLGGLCTNATPGGVWRAATPDPEPSDLRALRDLYGRPHLPQGVPTSPALANLCTYRLDCRLSGLAKAVEAVYTRYADDLAFSGGHNFERCVKRFSLHVGAILGEEGFAANHHKTRLMRQGVRQHLAGLTTNQRINVKRTDFDRLKAVLTNCLRQGPESQNREGHPRFREHLFGRVSFVEMINPEKGKRLRTLQ